MERMKKKRKLARNGGKGTKVERRGEEREGERNRKNQVCYRREFIFSIGAVDSSELATEFSCIFQ